MASIDSGYPKRIHISTAPSGSVLVVYASCRDQYGRFWVVGDEAKTPGGERYPHVWRFASDLSFDQEWEISGGVIEASPGSNNQTATDICIDSEGVLHIVGNYRDTTNNVYRPWYSYFDDTSWVAPVRLDTEISDPTKGIVWEPSPRIVCTSTDDKVCVWDSRGWNPADYNRTTFVAKIKYSTNWTSANYFNASSNAHYIDAVAEYETGKVIIGHFRSGEIAEHRRVYRSGASVVIDSSSIFTISITYSPRYWNGKRQIFDDTGNSIHTIFYKSTSPNHILYMREGGTPAWPTVGLEANPKSFAPNYNISKAMASYTRTNFTGVRRRENFSSGNPGTWDSELILSNSYAISLYHPHLYYPVINSKRVSMPDSGFMFFGSSNNDFLGGSETRYSIYIWSIDSLSWPTPESLPVSLVRYSKRSSNPGWSTKETVASGIKPQISLAQNGYVYISYLDENDNMKSTRKQLTISGWETSWTTATGVLNFQTQWAFFPRGEIKSYNEPLWGVSSIIERNSVYYHKIDGALLDTGYIGENISGVIGGLIKNTRGAVISGSL